MNNPIEQIVQHIEELNSSIQAVKRKGNGRDHVTWDSFSQLMQAKSTALVALAQAEANAIRSSPLVYSFGPDVDVERI